MLRRTLKMGFWVAAGVFLFAGLALAGTKQIHLGQDVVLPGGQTLQAGTYSVVVNESLDQVQFLKGSKVVATHACKCVPQEKKNTETQVLTEQGPGNTQVLQEIMLRGETRIITLPS
ncbi:MAG TPA: hypothetical protein VFL79_21075 [Terriglobia bacterium]|nr:hypothetical protein [Terriglobia bacterium]